MAKHSSLNIPTSIVISGVESDTYFDIVVRKNNIRFVLMSYHYLQGKPKNFLKKRIEEFPDLRVFIDSGAHTFFQKIDEYRQKDEKFWDEYLTKYTEWVKDNSDYIFACANLDIEAIVGIDKVDEWNDKYFKPVEESGVEVCYIWHSERGESGWEEYAKKHSYIGLSMANDRESTVQKLMKRLKVAEKYNTRVHGMALTKTEILVRVPFFTADSTSWLVGQQFGELNWFNGRKMQRLSKDQWRRQYKTQLLKEPFNADWELLTTGMGGKGDTYELLRLNVIAYKLAEEHIRKRLKTKMYWLPKGDEATEVVEVDSLETPPYEWFDGECDDWKQYLMKLRIMPSGYSKEEAIDLLYFFYIFLNEDYRVLEEDFEKQEIIDYAQAVISESIEDYESAVEALRDYFVKNATGERNDLRGEDDMDEELGIARPKEREVYIEEDAFDIIDLSEEQIEEGLHLPAPKDASMPEIEAYDEELARNNIVAVRDDKGRFLKGQQAVRKPKNIYSKKYPKLNCDTCYKSGDCPEYKPGYVCAFDKMFKRFDTRNAEDVIDAMSSMINHNLERLQRAMMFEIMDGGMATPEVTGLIDQNAKLLEKLQQLQQLSSQTIIQQRRIYTPDGTETIENSMSVNPSSGGILSQIFGTPSKATKDEDVDSPKRGKEDFEDVIEVDYEDGE